MRRVDWVDSALALLAAWVVLGLSLLGPYACSQVVPCSMLDPDDIPHNRLAECMGK
jgi:hypothetical protein